MNLPAIAIRNHVFTWMLMLGLILFGGLAYRELGISYLPDVDFPTVNVRLNLEGAAPEVMETQVIDPVESALLSVEGIKTISSSARNGSGSITLEFDLSKNIDTAVQEIQTKMAQIQRRLPDEIESPTISKSNPEDRPILWLSFRSDKMAPRQLMEFVRDRVKDQFTTLPGVSEVFLGGYIEPNLRVWVSADKLNQYALTVDDVLATIEKEHQELPAGRFESPTQETAVRVLGEASSVEEFKDIVISRRGGAPSYRPIYLKQVAEVEDGLADIRRISRTRGVSSVGIGIIKQRGSNAVAVGDAVREKIQLMEKELPEGASLSINFDSTKFIKDSVHELVFTLILSALLTAIVCWLFLGSWSATINVLFAIPTSIVGSFIVLKLLNFTLNNFTILALSLAIGIVVDDAIMVLENIIRYMEKGKTRMEASLVGSKEITFAALAATAAIVAIFLPVAFMKGVIGRYFFQFGVTLSVAVTFSLLEALTLTPMRCSQFLVIDARNSFIGRSFEASLKGLTDWYTAVLQRILNWPWSTVLTSAVLFGLSLLWIKVLKKEFVPAQDQGSFMARVKAPEGSSIELTNGKVKAIETILGGREEVANYYAAVGGFGGGEVNTAMLFITLKDLKDRGKSKLTGEPLSQTESMAELRKLFSEVKGIKVILQDPSTSSLGGQRGFPIEFTLLGPDWETLAALSEKLVSDLEKSEVLTDVNSDYVPGNPEIQISPNRIAASQYGVSIADIGRTISTLIGGYTAGMYTNNGKRYDIRVRLEADERSSIRDLEPLNVRNNRGELIPLSRLVNSVDSKGPQTISRLDRERAITITANVAKGFSQEQALEKVNSLNDTVVKHPYRLALSGSSREFRESMESLIFALVLGIIIAYMILASQFNSFIHPISVLMALPFSFSGALAALWLGGQSLNIYSMIGILLLMGIVKKNSILLVDFTNERIREGMETKPALLSACPTRLRPILMTSFSTIAAAIPAACNFGPGAESRIPMAMTVIGGILVSTLLTLFVVPSAYLLMSGKRTPRLQKIQDQ